jgi:hypothetical protein
MVTASPESTRSASEPACASLGRQRDRPRAVVEQRLPRGALEVLDPVSRSRNSIGRITHMRLSQLQLLDRHPDHPVAEQRAGRPQRACNREGGSLLRTPASRRRDRIARGLCGNCGRPLFAGASRCLVCIVSRQRDPCAGTQCQQPGIFFFRTTPWTRGGIANRGEGETEARSRTMTRCP